MAVSFSVEHSRTSEYRFDPDDIIVKAELNGRHELPDISWLIQSIVERGQIQPVSIRREEDKPVLVAGFSRWRAVKEINDKKLTPVPVSLRCTYFQGNEIDGFLANIAENKARNETTPMDDAYNIVKLDRWGLTLDKIAAIYRQSEAWVEARRALVNLAPEAQEAVNDGRLKPTAAAVIGKLTAAKQKEIIKKTEGKKISAKDAKAATGKDRAPTKIEVYRAFIEEVAVFDTAKSTIEDLQAQRTKAQNILDKWAK